MLNPLRGRAVDPDHERKNLQELGVSLHYKSMISSVQNQQNFVLLTWTLLVIGHLTVLPGAFTFSSWEWWKCWLVEREAPELMAAGLNG